MKKILIILGVVSIFMFSCESSDSSSDTSSGTGGSMARFTITGNHLYTVTKNELDVYDISTSAKPKLVNKIDMYNYVETIFPKDTLLFLGTRSGMLIYDNSNPEQPKFLSEYWHIYSCDPVVVDGNYAYVTLNSESSWCGRNNNRLDIIDISDLKNPTTVAEYPMTSPKGLGIENDMLFLCDDGLKVYDVTNRKEIDLVKEFAIKGYDVIPKDGYLLLIGEQGFYQYSYNNNSVNLISSLLID